MKYRIAATVSLFLLAASPVHAQTPAETQAVELAKQAIAIRSVRGPDNRTIDVAKLFADALAAGGWSRTDIDVETLGDTAYLVATWPGSDPSLGPIVFSAHMDVVEAKPEDWERDPFTPVIENGYLFGRGASDTKYDAALVVASMIELRKQGFKPKRSVVIAYSGDEETTMLTSQVIAERLKHAKVVLNVDSASGTLDEVTGKPAYWNWEGAEKTYADFKLEVTNPGGHSSTPTDENAIAQLSGALARISAYRFAPEINDITRDYFTGASNFESDPLLAAAMRAFAKDPSDKAAIAVLRASPSSIGKIETTCVPTMIEGGHALNALPQRATGYVNCRIFPGHSKAEIIAELKRVADEPALTIEEINPEYVTEAPASPYDKALVDSVTRALHAAYGNVPVIASQASGAGDTMWSRALGVPAYGASGTFTKDSDDYAHGLNERIPLAYTGNAIKYYNVLVRDLAAK